MARIAIVGCGPAGLAFATAMHGSDHELTIFERQPRPEARGSGFILQPSGLAAAQFLGIRQELESVGHRITKVEARTACDQRPVIDVNYELLRHSPYAVGLQRRSLFNALYPPVVEHEVPIACATAIQDYRYRSDRKVSLLDANRAEVGAFDFIVDASGARSALRNRVAKPNSSKTLRYGSLWVSLDASNSEFAKHVLHQRFAGPGQSVGLMPVGSESVGCVERLALFSDVDITKRDCVRRQGLATWKTTVAQIWPACTSLLDQLSSFEQLTLAVYRHHATKPLFKPGIVFIGDAASATSPLLGQGVNMSLIDAIVLAQEMRAQDDCLVACREYAIKRRWHRRVVQNMALSLIPFYKSNALSLAILRNHLYRPLSLLPFLDKFTALVVGGLLPDPRRYFGAHRLGETKTIALPTTAA
ncbi:MAG: FAD-dependent oxidoreductase [Gammaproteobacteria bacterium]